MRPVLRGKSLLAIIGSIWLSSGAVADAWQGEPRPGEGDKAFVPPAVVEPPLPNLPARPALDTASYPDCREDYRKIEAPFDQAAAINRCTLSIDDYYNKKMLPYREAMIAYQQALSSLYLSQVGGNKRYSAATQDRFYRAIMAEHAASDPEGANLAAYRGIEARYQTDRAYLADRFCFNTGCNGYPVPADAASGPVPPKAAKERKERDAQTKQASRDADPKCKRARKRGGALGVLLGGVAGSAAGLKGVGTAISGLVGAVLVAEIACQLDEKEQKVAAEATVAVTKKEEVGATAHWTSPTRQGVGGSSTITALNTEPNGTKCLAITDIAIIEGEETRVSKRMCWSKPGEPYSVMA